MTTSCTNLRFYLCCLGLSLACVGSVSGAEIRVKGTCQPQGSLVVLGDVAELFTTDADEKTALAGIELIPAPAPGAKRYLRSREIQDLLAARGVNLSEQRFSGAAQVTIETPVPAPVTATLAKPVEPAVIRAPQPQPQQAATAAILQYLSQMDSSETWLLELKLSAAAQQSLRKATGSVTATGGTLPWEGAQEFTLQIPTAEGVVQLAVNAEVRASRAVLAVVKALPKGSVLRAEDLQFVEPASHEHLVQAEEVFHSLEQVIGKETMRTVSPGQVLDANYVRSPLLVRKGEVVTVYARAAGITVRTTGRALSDGSAGELIAIETLETGRREKFDARVAGAQVVEIWAGGITGGGKR